MKTKRGFLDFYYKYAPDKNGDKDLPYTGLCGCIKNGYIDPTLYDVFQLLEPDGELGFGIREGTEEHGGAWGAIEYYPNAWKFNHFRQNVILLCAAINGEL